VKGEENRTVCGKSQCVGSLRSLTVWEVRGAQEGAQVLVSAGWQAVRGRGGAGQGRDKDKGKAGTVDRGSGRGKGMEQGQGQGQGQGAGTRSRGRGKEQEQGRGITYYIINNISTISHAAEPVRA
jgi:hypothetical protein